MSLNLKKLLALENKGAFTIHCRVPNGFLNCGVSDPFLDIYMFPGYSIRSSGGDEGFGYLPSLKQVTCLELSLLQPIKQVRAFLDKGAQIQEAYDRARFLQKDLQEFLTELAKHDPQYVLAVSSLLEGIQIGKDMDEGIFSASLVLCEIFTKIVPNYKSTVDKLETVIRNYREYTVTRQEHLKTMKAIEAAQASSNLSKDELQEKCSPENIAEIGKYMEKIAAEAPDKLEALRLFTYVKAIVVPMFLSGQEFLTKEEIYEVVKTYRPELTMLPEEHFQQGIDLGIKEGLTPTLAPECFLEFNELMQTYTLTEPGKQFALTAIKMEHERQAEEE